jgi:hypothetical protein
MINPFSGLIARQIVLNLATEADKSFGYKPIQELRGMIPAAEKSLSGEISNG